MFPRLAERRNQVAGTLSGGEQQMLAIGRAIMSKPKLIMFDEPSPTRVGSSDGDSRERYDRDVRAP
jgi:ABC-type branched-subunit amino acid transport system ATPase component